MRVTRHGKRRIVERTAGIENFATAKKEAKQARAYGKTLNHFQRYPKFFRYLQAKEGQTNTCSVRVYHGNIYIWRGKMQSLVTAHPIPDRYVQEMKEVDESENRG